MPVATECQPEKASYRITKGAVFKEPLVFVRPPEELGEGPFYPHNHVPSIAVLNNGDLFATWFSAKKECGRELTVWHPDFVWEQKSGTRLMNFIK